MTSSLGMLTQIGATAHPAGRRPAWSCCTTSRRLCGSRRCRRRRRSRLQRPSTTLHRLRAVRSCTSETFCADSDSGRGSLPRYTRTTPRASSGVTTSSAGGTCQAHRHPELRPRGHPERSDAARQGPNLGSDGRHPDQETTSSASTCMRRWSPLAVNRKHLRDLCPQKGGGRQG